MPFSAALFDTQGDSWHASAEHAVPEDGVQMLASFEVSTHHQMPVDGGASLCNDEPARLPSELSPPPLGAPTLALMNAYPTAVFPVSILISSGPRTRYPPGLRLHLTLGRIQV